MKSSGIPLASLPPHLQAQVRAQVITAAIQKQAKPRLRQSSKGPNKTEAAFAAYLQAQVPANAERPIFEQAVTLKLANGLRYTPDVFCPLPVPVFYEVKGFARDDAVAKLKVAASVHRWATFYLVTRRGRTCGGWDIQKILP